MRAEKELSVALLFSQSSPSDSSELKELLKREKRLTSPVHLWLSLSSGSESCSWCLLFNFPRIPAIFTSSSGQPDKEGMREENYVESTTITSFTSELALKEGVSYGRERWGEAAGVRPLGTGQREEHDGKRTDDRELNGERMRDQIYMLHSTINVCRANFH